MSVYNGQEHLREAVDSVLDQTFADFEFLIIDDGSTDRTLEILKGYDDSRIRLIEQENRGLVHSLNRGLEEARGKYIARMDADDVSLPERFSSQVAFLDAHPEIGILGTKVVYIDREGNIADTWQVPTLPGEIGWQLFFGTCLAHPSVMMRRELVLALGSYDGKALHAEDYDLWARAASMTKLANLESLQVQRRGWEGSVTQRHPEIQEETVRRVLRSSIKRRLAIDISADDVVSLRLLATEQIAGDLSRIKQVAALIPRMHHAYVTRTSLSDEEKRVVGLDAARKLYVLAHYARPLSRRVCFSVALRGVRLDPRSLREHSRVGLKKTIF
jgi:glycosyltransferase involved in cell wall biosynthesis